jgi:hypothetical protein
MRWAFFANVIAAVLSAPRGCDGIVEDTSDLLGIWEAVLVNLVIALVR